MNVKLPSRTWVDLYASTGITVGLQIKTINITPNDVRLADTTIEPTPADDHIPLLFGRGVYQNDIGDLGAWAMCVAGGAIDVKEV
jgi:hypothetical protein